MAHPIDNPPELRLWSSRFCCYVCRKAGHKIRATIRVFSGSYGGEGFPACADHEREAVTAAMEPLGYDPAQVYRPESYIVKAYAVAEDEWGFPYLARKLWWARRRILDPSNPMIR